jgi:hypothetical protein
MHMRLVSARTRKGPRERRDLLRVALIVPKLRKHPYKEKYALYLPKAQAISEGFIALRARSSCCMFAESPRNHLLAATPSMIADTSQKPTMDANKINGHTGSSP